jgi:hypothetical protein
MGRGDSSSNSNNSCSEWRAGDAPDMMAAGVYVSVVGSASEAVRRARS